MSFLPVTAYHVSTLLQVSNVAKQDQNMALASELCERALFSFGRVVTNAFRQDMERGRARLNFRRPENRQFWLAGYHYLRSLVRDRKSTRLNSSHGYISYAVFCLKKKKQIAN